MYWSYGSMDQQFVQGLDEEVAQGLGEVPGVQPCPTGVSTVDGQVYFIGNRSDSGYRSYWAEPPMMGTLIYDLVCQGRQQSTSPTSSPVFIALKDCRSVLAVPFWIGTL